MTRFTSEKVGYLAFLIFMNERENKIKKMKKNSSNFSVRQRIAKVLN